MSLVQPSALPEHHQVNRVFQQLVGICALLAVLVFISPLLQQSGFPAFSIIDGFLGASLQAFAFLAIGVLASAAVQVFISDEALRRIFPASVPAAVAVAVLISLVLPVCDCSSIPLFRSLARRRIPLPAAVTFLLAAPVANPLVVWSTYFAFNGDWSVVLCRLAIGLAVAVVVGLSFLVGGRGDIFRVSPGAGQPTGQGIGGKALLVGADSPDPATDGLPLYDPTATFRRRLVACLDHARTDFFDISRYLVLGIGLASVFKNLNTTYSLVDFSGLGSLVGIGVMMLTGYVLSLCSTSDAVIGRIFVAQMPLAPVLSFLVFGPMIDIKNTFMLTAQFKRGFVLRVALTAFVTAGLLVGLLSLTGVIA